MTHPLQSGETVLIRAASVSDAAAIITYMKQMLIESKNLLREPDEWTMTVEEEEAFLRKATTSDSQYMAVAVHDDAIIATAGFHGSSLRRVQHRVSLGISVLTAYQRQGLGKALMIHLIEQAKAMGKKTLELSVRVDNQGAIALYQQLGFVEEGVKKAAFYVDDKYIDLLLMALEL